jgi:dipeptide/tripeptide permease
MANASTATATGGGSRSTLLKDLAALTKEPRELWVIFALTLLECLAYYSVYNVLALYLREDLHYDDVTAGTVLARWLLANTVIVFFAGTIADALGVRRTLLIGFASCVIGRVMMSFAHSREIAMIGLYAMSLGAGSTSPTKTAAIRRYTSARTVAFGFSFYYTMINFGSFAVGPLVSWLRKRYQTAHDIPLPGGLHWHFGSAQALFTIASLASIASLALVAVGIRPDTEESPDGVATTPAARATKNPVRVLLDVTRDVAFWRFMLFVSLLVIVRLIFQHAHLTWPVYATREFGRTFPYATYWSINPLMIIFLTPIATALTRHRSAYATIVIGTFITAASVFFLAYATTVQMSVLFIVTLSIGEALWSPRLYEYTVMIAPKGRETSYMGLSQLPMFAAKPLVSWMSGALLASYCPATGARHSESMWLVIGLTTLIGPVLVVAMRRVIEGPATEAKPSAAT